MADSRHKHAVPRRAGLSNLTKTTSGGGSRRAPQASGRRLLARVAVPAAALVAVTSAGVAVYANDGNVVPQRQVATAEADEVVAAAFAQQAAQQEQKARRAEHVKKDRVEKASLKVKGTLLALDDGVAVRARPSESAKTVAELEQGDSVDVTGRQSDGYRQIVFGEESRWVKASEVGKDIPLGTKPCPRGDESGMQPDTVKVLRAVCERFPEITSYGGSRGGGGEHATGQALDIMLDSTTGPKVAKFLQENRAELGIEYLIYQQRIWRPATSPGWRSMSDRGDPTQNHMDHVHATTVGDAATS